MREPERSGHRPRRTVVPLRRRTLPPLLAVLLIAAGIVLSLTASFSVTTVVGREAFQGTAAPGDSLRPLNRADHSFARFTSDLPCPLIIYPLSEAEHQVYADEGAAPREGLHCDSPSLIKGQPVTHLLFRNVDPAASWEYTVDGEFFVADRPYAWMTLPGLILLAAGAIPAIFMLLIRGIGQFGEWMEEEAERLEEREK